MRTKSVTLQKLVTLFGPNATDEVAQRIEFSVDVSKFRKAVVKFQVINLDNVDLYLQTVRVKEKKYWRNTKTVSAVGTPTVVLTRDAGLTSEFMENFLRWRLAANGANWRITFRVQLFLK
jgi:hypothetical protein